MDAASGPPNLWGFLGDSYSCTGTVTPVTPTKLPYWYPLLCLLSLLSLLLGLGHLKQRRKLALEMEMTPDGK